MLRSLSIYVEVLCHKYLIWGASTLFPASMHCVLSLNSVVLTKHGHLFVYPFYISLGYMPQLQLKISLWISFLFRSNELDSVIHFCYMKILLPSEKVPVLKKGSCWIHLSTFYSLFY